MFIVGDILKTQGTVWAKCRVVDAATVGACNYHWVVRGYVGRDSSVSIATRNGLDGPEIESH